ncbi:MAG TPA: acyl carrier protein [Pseudonocardiaceae bacterium]|nr:acyl carrier protein [Pseudonocardiaceae bacterium]
MNLEQINAMVVEFVRGVDGVTGPVPATASFEDLGVDSMSTIDLLIKVEHEFGVEVPDEQLPMIVNIADLVNFVASAQQEVSR